MARGILIIGPSGSGKSSSMENLDPKTTFLINVVGKELPFKGYNKNYRPVTAENPEGNLVISDRFAAVRKTLEYVSNKRASIDTIVIDDAQYLMANEFMRRAYETGC